MVLLTRRDAIQKRMTSRKKILATILAGVVFLIVPILIIIIDPIHIIVKYKLRLSKGTVLYQILQNEVAAGRLSIYLFNITNADRFLAGEDYKLKVEEVGPFVFQEYRWYEDMEMNEDGKQMTMTPKFRTEFIPEDSLAHPRDINLTLPNLPMLSAATLMSNYPSIVRIGFNMLAAQLGAKAIMNINVHKFLWGYKNPFISIFHSLAPGLVYFDKIGLLDRLYDNESVYRVVVGTTDQDRFSIKSVKKFRHIQMGSITDTEESEQTFNDTYEGYGYPPMLTPDVPINLYRMGMCKTFNLEYVGSRTMDYGGEGFVYNISNKTFLSKDDPTNSRVYPNGLMDISRCYYGLPFVVSKAHFLDADPKLVERIDGLNPDRNVHINQITIDRKVSVTMKTKMSFQLSMVLDDISYNREVKMLSNTTIPVIHIKVDQPAMTENTMSKFVLVYRIAPFLVTCLIVVLFMLGLMMLAYAVRLIHMYWVSLRGGIVFETVDKINAELPLMK